MITAFAQHLVDRYGIDEVSQWYFEVWNEPNIDFWVGNPKQPTYFELYDHTAAGHEKGERTYPQSAAHRPHKPHGSQPFSSTASRTTSRSTSSAPTSMPTTPPKMSSAQTKQIPRDRMVCRSVQKVHDEIAASPFPKHASHLQRVQRQLRQRAQRHRHGLHGSVARQLPSASATASPKP